MILVTGSTGLLGSHVVVELLQKGHAVRAMYRSEERKEVVYRLLRFYYPDQVAVFSDRLSWFQGDIQDLIAVEGSLEGVDTVIHCAALVSFHRRDFHRLIKVNRRGTANMLNFALEKGIKRFIHVSSTAAVGGDALIADGLDRESNKWNPNDEVSGYAISKFSAEKEVWRAQEEGLSVAVVNPSVMFGPGSWDESSLTIFRTLNNGLRYYTRGANAFVDVRDVATVIRLLLEKQIEGERFLVTGTNTSFKNLFDQICKALGKKAPNILAGPWMTGLAWRASWLLAKLTGKLPTITKETARSSQNTSAYSNEKLLKAFPDFRFHTLEETIENTIRGRMD